MDHFLQCTNKQFQGVTVNENRIPRNNSKLCDICAKNCGVMSTPPVNDQNIYKKSSLESLFVETINSKKSNIIVGVIYRHRSMDVVDFSKNYLNRLSDKILKEVKNIFLLFDFDINLLRFNGPRPTNDFFESLACSSLFPYMLRLTQLTGHFKILFHNIFCNLTSCKKSQKI